MLPQHHHDDNTIFLALQALAFVRMENNPFQIFKQLQSALERITQKID
jgi:hypothetical protein